MTTSFCGMQSGAASRLLPTKQNNFLCQRIGEMKKKLSYIITSAFCAVITVVVLLTRETFSQTNTLTVYKDLCDAFFLPGVMTLGFGLLVFVSNGGAFSMLKFSVIKFVDLFRRDLTKVKYRTYYDYKEANKDNKNDFGFMLIIGAVFVAISVVFLILYHSID